MPSDVLQALLGLIAGGAEGYTGQKETLRKESITASENEAQRKQQEKLLNKSQTFQASESEKGRLSEKELTILKLEDERRNLHDQLKVNTDNAIRANATDRARIATDRDRIVADMDRVDREIMFANKKLDVEAGLTKRGQNIDQARYGLGGPLATGENGLDANKLIDASIQGYSSAVAGGMDPAKALSAFKLLIQQFKGGEELLVPPPAPPSPLPTPLGPSSPEGRDINSNYTGRPVRPFAELASPFIDYFNVMHPSNTGEGGISNYPSIDIETILNEALPENRPSKKKVKTLK